MPPFMHRPFLKFASWPLTSPANAPRLLPSAHAVYFRRFAHAALQPQTLDFPVVHHGPVTESQRAPRRWRASSRAKRYSLTDPPTNLLVQRLRNPPGSNSTDTGIKLRKVAKSNSPRLAVLAHQLVLRRDQALLEKDLQELLMDPLQWRKRLNKFSMKGIQEDDVHHWVWILQADDTDTKVDRLVASDRFVPIFVLMAILRFDERMVKGSSLVKIYDYLAKTYIDSSSKSPRALKEEVATGSYRRKLNGMGNMTPSNFVLVIRRLVHHCLTTFPSSLPMIARLVVSYIGLVPDKIPKATGRPTGYRIRCMLFNHALCTFRRTPVLFPLANLPHNWKAQKILLSYSAGLKRPLVISRWSYRAIRMVLIGLKKSQEEKMAASRYAKTWPPYIKQLDGTDEARDRAQYLSRSVKAGILKQSEGYSHDLVDHAVDTLGGSLPGRAVTIQTRSAPRGLWKHQHRSLQILAYWAAKVKATRNAHEAWQVFNEPPMAGVQPDFQVYAEMRRQETYPPHLANLTELERERVRPCSAQELYEKMVRSGQRPVHQCLTVLIRNAPSLDRAAEYLNDSPLHKDAVENMTRSLTPLYQYLVQIPIPIFDSYIALLCSRQGRRRWVPDRDHKPQPGIIRSYDHLKRAIQLICARLGPRRKPAMSPWHTVMRALANTRLVMRPHLSWAEDDLDALKTMITLFDAHTASQGLHPVPFDCLCRCILKVMRHNLPTKPENHTAAWSAHKRLHLATEARSQMDHALGMVKSAFCELIAPVQAPTDKRLSKTDSSPLLQHELSASHIRTYLEVLAKSGDVEEGVRVMQWLLATVEQSTLLEKAQDPRHKQWSMVRDAIVSFRAIVDACDVQPEVVAHIKQSFQELEANGGPWSWPTSEDVEEYVRWSDEKYKVPEVI
ncbi:hypothetical protein N0V93_008341 [Gnomoniopsis smithogilvyi]|uniref:Uncharacterized protein n=1 Tax=Gnomoniopsis smithogilvyi TaxID=1191159 RepID=A0A9W8YN01_9PEZI|nr:hypothetical protein N0V93_008341 [Gnomoniopsis smithogilvyi]